MSGGELLADGPDRHVCELPDPKVPVELRPGAVARCACGRYWVLDPIAWERVWRRVHPWPFDRRARRTIRQAEDAQLPGPARRGMGHVRW